MNAYRVRVSATVTDTIVVRARNPKDAERVASLCVTERITYDKSSAGNEERRDGVVDVSAETVSRGMPGDRIDTYTCSGCGESSPKTTFGPGWCKCPKCGAPPLPAESTVE